MKFERSFLGNERNQSVLSSSNDKDNLVSLEKPTRISTFSRPTSKGLERFLKFSPF